MKNNRPVFKRIAIKVGSNVIADCDGSLNSGRILRIVEEVAVLYKRGIEVILISSGAVAAGRSEVPLSKKTNIVAAKQVWAAIGQIKLMSSYQFLFSKYLIQVGQVLATRESFMDRTHYLNMKNCITAMLENHVLPVVNENDTISVNELMFTDNDELSGLISSLMGCDTLIILSNVDGVFNGVPGEEGTELIRVIDESSEDPAKYVTASKSGLGRGGMLTKCTVARKIAAEGIDVFIANGTRESVITDIIRKKDIPFTHFVAHPETKNSVKKWLAHSETFARGIVYVNKGAKAALLEGKASSLLMIGITRVEGFFKKGDIIRIFDDAGKQIGLGRSQYDSEKAEQYLGQKSSKPLVHYDYMVITGKS